MFTNNLLPTSSASLITKLQNVINLLLDFDRTVNIMLGYDRQSAVLATTVLTSTNASRLSWHIMLVDDLDVDDELEPYYSYQFNANSLCIAIFHRDIVESFTTLFSVAYLTNHQPIAVITDDPLLKLEDFQNLFEGFRDSQIDFYSLVVLHIQHPISHPTQLTFYRMAILNTDWPAMPQLQLIDASTELQGRHELYEQLFAFDDTIDLAGLTLPIRSELYPPHLYLTYADNGHSASPEDDLLVSGNQVMLLNLVGRYLNASVQFVEQRMSKSVRTGQKGSKEYYTEFREKLYRSRALDVTAPFISTPYFTGEVMRFKDGFLPYTTNYGQTSLYPHGRIDYVALVPKVMRIQSNMNDVLNSPLINVWALSTIIFTIARLCCRHFSAAAASRRHNQLYYIAFNTFGLSLGTTSPCHQATGLPERITTYFVSIFAILSGIFFSGLLMQSFFGHTSEPIYNSFEAWSAESALKVFLTEPLGRDDIDFENVERSRLYTRHPGRVFQAIVNRSADTVFIVPEHFADMLIAYDTVARNGGPSGYLKIKQPVLMRHCYIDVYVAPLAPRVNSIVQRIFERGLIAYFDTLSRRSLNVAEAYADGDGNDTQQSSHKSINTITPSDDHFNSNVEEVLSAVTLKELHLVLVVSSGGLVLGLVAFGLELICGRRRR